MTFTLNIQIERTKKIHLCEHELLKRESNITILIYSRLYSRFYSRFILNFILNLDYS